MAKSTKEQAVKAFEQAEEAFARGDVNSAYSSILFAKLYIEDLGSFEAANIDEERFNEASREITEEYKEIERIEDANKARMLFKEAKEMVANGLSGRTMIEPALEAIKDAGGFEKADIGFSQEDAEKLSNASNILEALQFFGYIETPGSLGYRSQKWVDKARNRIEAAGGFQNQNLVQAGLTEERWLQATGTPYAAVAKNDLGKLPANGEAPEA